MITNKDYKYIIAWYKPLFDSIDQMIKKGYNQAYITSKISLDFNLSLWDSVSLFLGYIED